jgi:hypothetical protein
MDFSKLSDSDLLALKSGDLSKVSDSGLLALKGEEPKASVEVPAAPAQFESTGGGAAMGKPRMVNRIKLLSEPRPLESALAGAIKSVIDPFLGVAQLATGGNLGTSELAKRLATQGEEYSQANPGSYLTGRIAGAVATAAGMSSAIGSIPSFAKLATATPKAAPYLQSAVVGGVAGGLTPEETGKTGQDLYGQQAKNATIGAAIGAPLPVLGKVFNVAKEAGKAVIEPFSESGKNIILGRALRNMAGNDAEKAIVNLRNAKEIVPGSMPTTGEVAGVPSIAAAQRSATATSPEAMNALAYRQEQQNLARQSALESAGGTSKERDILAMARENVANNAYDKAKNKIIDYANLPKDVAEESMSLRNTPAIKKAAEQAKINALNEGIDIKNPAGSIVGLHQTKMALDSQINALEAKLVNTPNPAGDAQLKGLKAAKGRLLSFLENDAISPEYKQARTLYANMSKPIEQMDIVQGIAKSSTNPLTNAIYPQKLAANVENLQGSNIVSTAQLEKLNAVKEDLARAKFAAEAGKGGGSDTTQKLAYANMLNQINLPTLLRRHGASATVGNALARASDVAYGGANKELSNKLAMALMNPRESAALMKLAGKEAKNATLTPEESRIIQFLITEGGVNATKQ